MIPGKLRIVLASIILFFSAWCRMFSAAPIQIVTTFGVLQEWAEHLTSGVAVKVYVLAPTESDGHTFEPTPENIIALEKAQVLFENGLGLEYNLDNFYKSSHSRAIRVRLGENPAFSPIKATHICCSHKGYCKNCYDPHVWFNVLYAIAMVNQMGETLCNLDPAHDKLYKSNTEKLVKILKKLHEWVKAETSRIPKEKRKLITYHDNWRYFAKSYDLEYVASVTGISNTHISDPSAAHVAKLCDFIKAAHVPAIFGEYGQNNALCEQIAHNAGLPKPHALYPTVIRKNPACNNYETLMRTNVQQLVQDLR